MTVRDLAFYVEGVAVGRRGVLVQRQKDRSVWRVEEDGRVWFAKRGLTPKRRREIRREASSARALEAAGFGATVLASGTHDSAEWIVTDDAGHMLGRALILQETHDHALRAAAEFTRALHQSGFATADLTFEHLRYRDGRVLLIDPARLDRRVGPVSMPLAARDLGALLFSGTIVLGNPSRTEQIRLISRATGLSGARLHAFCGHVDREIVKRGMRTRWRHGHTQTTSWYAYWKDCLTAWDDDAPPMPARSGEAMDAWRFDSFIDPEGMTVVRTLPDRENRTLGRGPDGKPLFFVKVFPPTKKGWSPAMRELAAIDLFQRAGILVNRVAAYAEDVDKGSMVAVKACDGEPLDDLLRRGVPVAERRALAVQTARIWRRMRECGLRHRDAYPCHLFAAPWKSGVDPLRFELRLIDLTRAGRAPFPKERWFVKDAAALWHGLPKPPVTRTDAARWLREYFRIPRLDARAKRFARRVAAKEARIAARQARKAKR